jgi:hypothetical protein
VSAEHWIELAVNHVPQADPLSIVVVKGNGVTQRQSYLWIGSRDDGGCYGTLERRDMRKLRDALTKALGEGGPL